MDRNSIRLIRFLSCPVYITIKIIPEDGDSDIAEPTQWVPFSLALKVYLSCRFISFRTRLASNLSILEEMEIFYMMISNP